MKEEEEILSGPVPRSGLGDRRELLPSGIDTDRGSTAFGTDVAELYLVLAADVVA
jgi:hypothetical protein